LQDDTIIVLSNQHRGTPWPLTVCSL